MGFQSAGAARVAHIPAKIVGKRLISLIGSDNGWYTLGAVPDGGDGCIVMDWAKLVPYFPSISCLPWAVSFFGPCQEPNKSISCYPYSGTQ